MDTVSKLQYAAKKKLNIKKGNRVNSSGGEDLQQVVKDATAKTLSRPDYELNQRVAELIGAAITMDGPEYVARTLTERLEQKNTHKVWLAIVLIRDVMAKTIHELGPAREMIMVEVQKVANTPLDRFDKNLDDQQRTKRAAFDLLRTYGQDGHTLSQPHLEPQRNSLDHAKDKKAQGNKSLQELMEHIETQMVMADSHNDLLQDLLLDTTSFKDKSPQDQVLSQDVLLDATKFNVHFEKSINHLTNYDTPEAQKMLSNALAKIDMLNNSLNLHKELIKQQAGEFRRNSNTGPDNKHANNKTTIETAPKSQLQATIDLLTPDEPPTQSNQSTDPFAASDEQYYPHLQRDMAVQQSTSFTNRIQDEQYFQHQNSANYPGQQPHTFGQQIGYPVMHPAQAQCFPQFPFASTQGSLSQQTHLPSNVQHQPFVANQVPFHSAQPQIITYSIVHTVNSGANFVLQKGQSMPTSFQQANEFGNLSLSNSQGSGLYPQVHHHTLTTSYTPNACSGTQTYFQAPSQYQHSHGPNRLGNMLNEGSVNTTPSFNAVDQQGPQLANKAIHADLKVPKSDQPKMVTSGKDQVMQQGGTQGPSLAAPESSLWKANFDDVHTNTKGPISNNANKKENEPTTDDWDVFFTDK